MIPFQLDGILVEEFFVDLCLINAKNIGLDLIDEVIDGIFIENTPDSIDIPHCKLEHISCITFSCLSFKWCLFFKGSASWVGGLLNKFTGSDFGGRFTHLHVYGYSGAVLML